MNRRAFTLVELMVATALGMVVMGLAVTAYRHSQQLIKRSEALVRLHRQAGDIAEQWERDMANLLHHVACQGSVAYASGAKRRVQFTGMRSLREFWANSIYGLPCEVDTAWVRWEWKAASRRLTRAQSPPPHWYVWYPNLRLPYIDNSGISFREVIGMRPNPVRTFAEFTSGQVRINDPLSATPSAIRQVRTYDQLFLTGFDIDGSTRTYQGMTAERTKNPLSNKQPNDYCNDAIPASTWASTIPAADQARVLADDVEDCSLSIVRRSELVVDDGGAGFSVDIDGEPSNGLEVVTNLARPQRLRLSFTLVDRATGVRQSFSFCSKAP